jgi:hypothetical protein
VQAEDFIEFSEQQQTAVRTDLRTMEFQPHPSVKTKSDITRFACTLRVIHYLPPST